ncbi:hypothetical protein [Gordonia lacunae]|uniref:Uncharacterized protein n=1 Tax=Gordonia lacunae TaxID=417102 RepID=A0A243Q7F3_9ACTN|nr:hypothetical protein [Gordonia lacunae]OUC77289.1 hypothetical protein CA982_17850 [Gordonia lacunae]
MSHYDQAKKDMEEVRTTLADAVARIRANDNYSAEGKRREIARVTLTAREAANALKTDHANTRAQRRSQLQRELFGSPSDASSIILLRDSQDRAAALKDPEQADAMMQRAIQSGDTYLAKAVAQVSINHGWNDPVRALAHHDPDTGELINELAELPEGPRTVGTDKLVFRVPNASELGDADDEGLARMAGTYSNQEKQQAARVLREYSHTGNVGV